MSKGSRREREAVEIYRNAGYQVYRPATVQYGENDMFGIFDLMAFGYGELRLVQVKSNRATGIIQWAKKARVFQKELDSVVVEYAVPVDDKGWRLIQIDSDGYETVYDGRQGNSNMGDGLTEYLKGGGNDS